MTVAAKDQRDGRSMSCPECNSTHIIRDEVHAEVVCGECGLVLQEGVEGNAMDPPAREFTDWNERPTLRQHDRGMATNISPSDRDYAGTVLDAKRRRQFSRLRALQYRSRFSRPGEKTMAEGLSLLNKVGSHLFLPKPFLEEAAYLYRKAAEAGIIRGRTIAGFVGASLYITARMSGNPRTLPEVVEAVDVPKRQVTVALKVMTRNLGISLPPVRPEDYVQRFVSEVGLPTHVSAVAQQILAEVRKAEWCNSKRPRGSAAAAIYVAARALGHRVSQSALSKVARVSEVTIRTRVREIGEEIGLEYRRGRPVYAGVHKCLRDVCLL